MPSSKLSIAIDGPVAAGKSTIARLVASRLGLTYIDTGAMYRALAWAAAREGISADDPARAVALLARTRIELIPEHGGANRVLVDGRDVTSEIRTPEIGQLASQLSTFPEVRARMVARQRELARQGGVVMEGRDIQTVVLPDAEVKIFLIATPEERARRRCLELQEKGQPADYASVLADLAQRDARDTQRAAAPLQPAPDAVHLDSSGLSIEEVVERVLGIAEEVRNRSDSASGQDEQD
jgi:CMP/dCMP kinase